MSSVFVFLAMAGCCCVAGGGERQTVPPDDETPVCAGESRVRTADGFLVSSLLSLLLLLLHCHGASCDV